MSAGTFPGGAPAVPQTVANLWKGASRLNLARRAKPAPFPP